MILLRSISLYCDDFNEWRAASMKVWFIESCKMKTLPCFDQDMYETDNLYEAIVHLYIRIYIVSIL